MAYYDPRQRRRAVPIPRRLPTISIPAGCPYVSPVRPPLSALPQDFTPVTLLQDLQQVTPWTQPRTLPALPGNTPIWPSSAFPLPTPIYSTVPLLTPIWPSSAIALPTPVYQTASLPVFWEPGTFPVEPFGTPVPLRLHPNLIYNPLNPLVPSLQWDIIHRAEQAKVLTGRQVIVSPDLSQQAVVPGASSIWIFSDHHNLASWMESWGPIIVEKPNITIRDVLDAIWNYFQQPLTQYEVDRITADPSNIYNLTYSAQQRAHDSFELYPVGLIAGFRRADVLGGHRRFQGLRPVVYQNLTWKVFMGLLPGPVPRFA